MKPGTRIDHYEIIRELGAGGMGTVYLAKDTKLSREVALKCLVVDQSTDAEIKKRFLHEAKAQAIVNHPNVATFYDVGETPSVLYIVMEFIEGRSFAQALHEEESTSREVLDLMIQAGEGLAAAHAQDVIHRDIKPSNLMVTSKNQVKILDFGLARWKGASKLTRTGTQMGTAAYMSPEQASGEKLDHRSDIFSFGSVLYQMLCKRVPFEGVSDVQTMYEIVHSEPHPPARYSRDVSPELERIVLKCLAKDKSERYQSMSDLLADLRRAKSAGGGAVGHGVTRKSRRMKIVLGVVAIIAAIGLVALPRPWSIVADKGAIAADNHLAVLYFDNISDPEDGNRASDMFTSLLIADLSESEYMRVVSRQRLYDILMEMGSGGSRHVDVTTATAVGRKSGARLMVTGDILQFEPTLVITSTISEVESGTNVASQRIEGQEGESMFAVVDRLSHAIRQDLDLPKAAQAEPDPPVAQLTSESADAYKAYLEGVDYINQWKQKEALDKLLEAITHDSTMALAYYELANPNGPQDIGLVSMTQAVEYVNTALKFSTNSSWRDQRMIQARVAEYGRTGIGDLNVSIHLFKEVIARYPDDKEAYFGLAMAYDVHDRAHETIQALETVVELDPSHKVALNFLVYKYQHANEFEKAMAAVNQYIKAAPEDANAYDTRGDLYRNLGNIDDAMRSYAKAVAIDPGFDLSWLNMGYEYVQMRDYRKADSCYNMVVSSPNVESRIRGRNALVMVPAHKGQFARAIQISDDAVAADRLDGSTGFFTMFKLMFKAMLLDDIGRHNEAVEAIRASSMMKRQWMGDTTGHADWIWLEIPYLARAGRLEEADSAMAVLKNWMNTGNQSLDSVRLHRYHYAMGAIADARGEFVVSKAHYDTMFTVNKDSWLYLYQIEYGKMLLRSGDMGGASKLFQDVLEHPRLGDASRSFVHWDAEVHYFLGQTYEAAGWKDQAIEEYETFLTIWEEADSGLPMVVDAERRLEDLKS